jgi:hypothetical protein
VCEPSLTLHVQVDGDFEGMTLDVIGATSQPDQMTLPDDAVAASYTDMPKVMYLFFNVQPAGNTFYVVLRDGGEIDRKRVTLDET